MSPDRPKPLVQPVIVYAINLKCRHILYSTQAVCRLVNVITLCVHDPYLRQFCQFLPQAVNLQCPETLKTCGRNWIYAVEVPHVVLLFYS